jgi:hypothetical protein
MVGTDQAMTNPPQPGERLARELLADAYEKHGCPEAVDQVRRGKNGFHINPALDAISRALSTERAAEGWQDIESAPRDGTRIIFTGPNLAVSCGMWRGERPPGFPSYRWSDEWIGWTREAFQDRPLNPTLWQPLPLSPLTPTRARGDGDG